MPGPISEPYGGPSSLEPPMEESVNPVPEGKSIIRVIIVEELECKRMYVHKPLYARATSSRPDNSRPYNFELIDDMEEALPYDDLDTAKKDRKLAELVNGRGAVAELLLSVDGYLVLVAG